MKMILNWIAVLMLSLIPAGLYAQDAKDTPPVQPQHFYRVHFAVIELDAGGKVTNSRTYEETIATSGNGHVVGDQRVKTGSRVPIVTGSNGPDSKPLNTQFQYIDLGVNLDVHDAAEHGEMLGFRLVAEVSSVAHQTEIAGMGEPVIRQNVWDSTVLVPLGKPTVVFSSDDLDSKGKMQVEVTATRAE
jgi:hypothetical protein